MKSYVLNAIKIKEALDNSSGSLRNSKASVISVDASKGNLEKAKISNTSYYHYFKPESTGLRAWEFQGIGPGKHIPYQPLNFHPSSDVLVPFQDAESSKKSDTLIKTKSRKSTAELLCHDRECVEVFFNTEKELDAHLNIGKHSYSMQVDNRCTTDDKVRILFAKKVKRSILLKVMPQRITQEHEKNHGQKKYKETKTKHQGKE